jgi:hypothetical protein
MSSSSLKLRTPAKVDRDILPEESHGMTRAFDAVTKGKSKSMKGPRSWMDVLTSPWNRWSASGDSMGHTALTTIHVGLMVFLAKFMFVFVTVYSLGTGVLAGTDAFILGLGSAFIQAGLYYGISQMWTQEKDLPIYVFSGLAWTEFFTFSGVVSLAQSIFYTVVDFIAGMAAGFACISLNNGATVNWAGGPGPFVTNRPITDAGYAMYAVGVLLISLFWVYNRYLASDHQKEHRAVKATTVLLFVFVLSFQALGVRYYDAATYLGASIYDGHSWLYPTTGTQPVWQWAYFIFVPIAMYAAAGFVLFGIFHLMSAKSNTTSTATEYEPNEMKSQVQSSYTSVSTSKLLKNRIDVEY